MIKYYCIEDSEHNVWHLGSAQRLSAIVAVVTIVILACQQVQPILWKIQPSHTYRQHWVFPLISVLCPQGYCPCITSKATGAEGQDRREEDCALELSRCSGKALPG